jgi:digeranylgeranylglycerophospholipid reductase
MACLTYKLSFTHFEVCPDDDHHFNLARHANGERRIINNVFIARVHANDKAEFDVTVIGGSLAGLLAARESADKRFKVLVLEEDTEIGSPEKCGGLVSLHGIAELGLMPKGEIINEIRAGTVISPSGLRITIDAKRQRLGVVSRRQLDKRVARQALEEGAHILVGERVIDVKDHEVITQKRRIVAKWIVDAGGAYSYVKRNGRVAKAIQCDAIVRGLDEQEVMVFLDYRLTAGFFSWVIPLGDNWARLGAAAVQGDPMLAIQNLEKRLDARIIKRVAAPLVIGGPIKSFSEGKSVLVAGDAAGQAKPTTAGGIYTSGLGGLLAGRVLREALDKEKDLRNEYEKEWVNKFGKEFRLMWLMRRVYERMDNKKLDSLLKAVKEAGVDNIEFEVGSFDEHSRALRKILKLSNLSLVFEMADDVLSALVESLFHNIVD